MTRIHSIILALVVGICDGEALGQVEVEWERLYSTGQGLFSSEIIQAANGDYVLCGQRVVVPEDPNQSYGNIFIFRINENGDSLWSFTSGSDFHEGTRSIIETQDECLVVTGFEQDSLSNFYCITMKLNGDGELLWSTRCAGFNPQQIIQTVDDGFIIVGEMGNWIQGNTDAAVLYLDSEGDSLWSRQYGGEGSQSWKAVIQTEDSDLLLAGGTTSNQGQWDGYLVKTDRNGRIIWSRTYDLGFKDSFSSICELPNGSYVLGGNVLNRNERPMPEYFWAMEVDSTGDSLWSKTYGDTCDKFCYSLIGTSQRGYALCGLIATDMVDEFGFPTYDYLLMRIDERGELLWKNTFGGEGNQMARDFILTQDGSFLIIGENEGSIYLVKTRTDAIPRLTIPLLEPNDGDTLDDYIAFFSWDAYPDSVLELVNSYSVVLKTGEDSIFVECEEREVEVDFYDLINSGDEWQSVSWWVAAVIESDTVHSLDNHSFWAYPEESFVKQVIPVNYTIFSAYPNPFNSRVTIPYRVGSNSNSTVQLSIYDQSGRMVDRLNPGISTVGLHSLTWDATGLPTGVYVVKLNNNIGMEINSKVVLVK